MEGGHTGIDIVKTIVLAIIGGGGIVGLLFFFLRKYIEDRLEANEEKERKLRAIRVRRMQIEDELHHGYGRVIFWLVKAIITGEHNGELEKAFKQLEMAEQKKKDLDREIIADQGID